MFRRALQPTYRPLAGRCLISKQFAESPASGQRRHFVKKIIKQDRKTKLVFLASFSTGLAALTYNDYMKKEAAKPSTAKITSPNKSWDSYQRTINDSLSNDSLVGCYVGDSVLDNLKIHKNIDGKKLPGKRLILMQYRY